MQQRCSDVKSTTSFYQHYSDVFPTLHYNVVLSTKYDIAWTSFNRHVTFLQRHYTMERPRDLTPTAIQRC